MTLDTHPYGRLILLDTQMIFEARPLHQLPWHQLTSEPILLLIPPQVLTELDAKKRDGRLGKRAREFNRAIEPNVETGAPVTISPGPPRVDMSLVTSRRIDWSTLDDLEPDNGDDRIVAQALHASVDEPAKIEIMSFDARPRAAARRHGLAAIRPDESWLLEAEPSPDQRKIAELQQRISVLSATQPELGVSLNLLSNQPLEYLSVPSIDERTAKEVQRRILRRHPKAESDPFSYALRSPGYDSDYAKWASELVKRDIPNLHQGLTRLYSQHEVKLELRNDGQVPAEHLCLEVSVEGGARLHPGPVNVQIFGPPPPDPHSDLLSRAPFTTMEDLMQRRDRDELYRDSSLDSASLKYVCGDYRHGRVSSLSFFLVLAEATPRVTIKARATAANMRGDLQEQIVVAVTQTTLNAGELVDWENLTLTRDSSALNELWSRIEQDELDDVSLFRNDGRRTRRH
jgi:hypothetical protein